MRNAALYSRGLLSALTIVLGIVILYVWFRYNGGGFTILPGVVLGLAMIAYGVRKISLIVRLQAQ